MQQIGFSMSNEPIFIFTIKTPTIKDFITTQTLNFHSKLPLATGALFYFTGRTSIHLRLKP